MDKMKINMAGPIILVAGIIALVIFRYNVKTQDENKIKNYEAKGLFTLGQVVDYTAKTYGANGVGSSASLKFSFHVDGKEYIEESDYGVPENNGPRKGSLFMAVYLPSDPRRCVLLLDFPVKDRSDYDKYLRRFKIERPKLAK